MSSLSFQPVVFSREDHTITIAPPTEEDSFLSVTINTKGQGNKYGAGEIYFSIKLHEKGSAYAVEELREALSKASPDRINELSISPAFNGSFSEKTVEEMVKYLKRES